MQHQTVPQTFRVTFDPLADVGPLTIPVPATRGEIATKVREAFEAAGVEIDAKVGIDLATGAVTVANEDGDIFERGRIEGPGIPEQPKPDYWLTLADDLRQAADRIATLAGTPKPKNGARLAFHCGLNDRDHETTRPVVDAIAAVFDATTKATPSGGSGRYEADGKVGELGVWPWAYIPAPDDAEKAAMRAELDALRAQLAKGGATR